MSPSLRKLVYSIDQNKIPHYTDHSSPVEQTNDYNSNHGSSLVETSHFESMDHVLTQTISCYLLEENHTNLESSSPDIVIVGTNTCDEEDFIPKIDIFNEHRLEENHAQDKTSFYKILIDDVYMLDYEVFVI